MVATVLEPSDQKRRRRRSRVTQAAVAARLNVSQGAISEYENGKADLPFELTPEDYERALAELIPEQS